MLVGPCIWLVLRVLKFVAVEEISWESEASVLLKSYGEANDCVIKKEAETSIWFVVPTSSLYDFYGVFTTIVKHRTPVAEHTHTYTYTHVHIYKDIYRKMYCKHFIKTAKATAATAVITIKYKFP